MGMVHRLKGTFLVEGGGIVHLYGCLHEVPVPAVGEASMRVEDMSGRANGAEEGKAGVEAQTEGMVEGRKDGMEALSRAESFKSEDMATKDTPQEAIGDKQNEGMQPMSPAAPDGALDEERSDRTSDTLPNLVAVTGEVPLVGKRMRGDIEIAVLPDNSHRYIRGQRTFVRLQLVG